MVTGKSQNPTRFARYVLYPLAAVLFMLLLAVILTLANGFRFTYANGKISLTKTGMLIVTTRPFDALISLNGKATKYRTGFYLMATEISSLKPGRYDVEISKNGYRTWKDSLEINPNLVTWANYVLLFAEKLNITKISVPAGKVLTSSDNGRHLLISNTDNGKFTLKSVDTGNLNVKDLWPTAAPTDSWLVSPQILTAQYSPNNDRTLLAVANGTKTQYYVTDSSGSNAKIIDINANLKVSPENVWWDIANNNDIYVQSTNGISHVAIDATSLPTPLISTPITFQVDANKILLYVAKNADGTYSASRMNMDGGNKSVLVESLVPASSYQLGYSPQSEVLTVLNRDNGDLTAYYLGNAVKKYSVKLSSGVTAFEWTKNGKFVSYYGKDFVKRFEWEKNKETVATLTDVPTSLYFYFDECHYIVTDKNGVHVMDYDGSNVVAMAEEPVVTSVLDEGNNNIIFAIKDVYYRFNSEF
jgi:hypothetical protein